MKSHHPHLLPMCLILQSSVHPLLCLGPLPHHLPWSQITHHSLERLHSLTLLPFQLSINSNTILSPPHFLYNPRLLTRYLPLLAPPSVDPLQLPVAVEGAVDYNGGLGYEKTPQVSTDTDRHSFVLHHTGQAESPATSLQPPSPSLPIPRVGEKVLASWRRDNKWYVATIDKISETRAHIIYLDGDHGQLQLSSLLPLVSHLLLYLLAWSLFSL